MAASMVRSYVQMSTSKLLVDMIWREQNVYYILQTLGVSHVPSSHYHATPVHYKKRKSHVEKKSKVLFSEELLNDNTLLVPVKKSVPIVEVWNGMTVKELATSAGRNVDDILDVMHFISKGKTYNEDHVLTTTLLISNVVKKLGKKAKLVAKKSEELDEEAVFKDIIRQPPPDDSQLVKRHPVVTIMGHVDHGKTTLLDALRNTSVVDTEFGGITQHIGAFDVTLKSGERVTFLDTPGHAAFSAMRHRGAHITDIVVLVVAADDGVMDQTLQSIEMAKDANVPIIVAINKIDKPNANIKKTQNELAKHGIITEEIGGDVQCVPISALKGTNLENLTEAIVLQAELMNLRGDPAGLVEGVVIECGNHIGRGKLVTALIQRGTLRKGSLLVSGVASAKVRAMFNDSGHPVLEAKPSEAIQIIGWRALPEVGDEILEVKNDRILQQVLKFKEREKDNALAIEHKKAADKKEEKHLLEYKRFLGIKWLFGKNRAVQKSIRQKKIENEKERLAAEKTDIPTVNIVIKGDVAGSVEALLDIFDTYTYDNLCRLNVVHYGIGAIVDSDIQLANVFKAIVYGFNVRTTKEVEEDARQKGVPLRFYNVVYKLIDNIREEINNILPIVDVEQILGEAKVLQQFTIKDGKKKVNVAGCMCVKGVLLKSEMYHVLRKGENIYTGNVVSMRHVKEEMPSIEANLECGLRFEDPTISFEPNDIIICFKKVKQQQKIDWDPGF